MSLLNAGVTLCQMDINDARGVWNQKFDPEVIWLVWISVYMQQVSNHTFSLCAQPHLGSNVALFYLFISTTEDVAHCDKDSLLCVIIPSCCCCHSNAFLVRKCLSCTRAYMKSWLETWLSICMARKSSQEYQAFAILHCRRGKQVSCLHDV